MWGAIRLGDDDGGGGTGWRLSYTIAALERSLLVVLFGDVVFGGNPSLGMEGGSCEKK